MQCERNQNLLGTFKYTGKLSCTNSGEKMRKKLDKRDSNQIQEQLDVLEMNSQEIKADSWQQAQQTVIYQRE